MNNLQRKLDRLDLLQNEIFPLLKELDSIYQNRVHINKKLDFVSPINGNNYHLVFNDVSWDIDKSYIGDNGYIFKQSMASVLHVKTRLYIWNHINSRILDFTVGDSVQVQNEGYKIHPPYEFDEAEYFQMNTLYSLKPEEYYIKCCEVLRNIWESPMLSLHVNITTFHNDAFEALKYFIEKLKMENGEHLC